MTTNDIAFVLIQDGEIDGFVQRNLINGRNLITVVTAENVWADSAKRFCYNWSYRILITPSSNLKYGWAKDNQITELIRYTDIHKEFSVGLQRSVLRQIQNQNWS